MAPAHDDPLLPAVCLDRGKAPGPSGAHHRAVCRAGGAPQSRAHGEQRRVLVQYVPVLLRRRRLHLLLYDGFLASGPGDEASGPLGDHGPRDRLHPGAVLGRDPAGQAVARGHAGHRYRGRGPDYPDDGPERGFQPDRAGRPASAGSLPSVGSRAGGRARVCAQSGGSAGAHAPALSAQPREAEVLRELVLTQDKQDQISNRLCIQIRTLQNHVTRLYRKNELVACIDRERSHLASLPDIQILVKDVKYGQRNCRMVCWISW